MVVRIFIISTIIMVAVRIIWCRLLPSYLLLSWTLLVLTHISTSPIPGWNKDKDFQTYSGSKKSRDSSHLLSLPLLLLLTAVWWIGATPIDSVWVPLLFRAWCIFLWNSCHSLHFHPQSTISQSTIHILPIWRALSSRLFWGAWATLVVVSESIREEFISKVEGGATMIPAPYYSIAQHVWTTNKTQNRSGTISCSWI